MSKKIFTLFFGVSLLLISIVPIYSQVPQRELNVIGNVHNFDLNPHTASYASEAQILSGLFEGLFSYNPYTLDPEPALAESFKISKDKLTWTFTIRKNACFSDGQPITAAQIRDSWLKLLNPRIKAPFASLLDCIRGAADYRTGKTKDAETVGIIAQNEKTLVVKLASPTEHFSKLLCHHAFSVVNPNPKIYSGAFVLKEYTGQNIVMVKNEKYWDAESVALPSIKTSFSEDLEQNTYLFNTGAVQWISGNAQTQYILDKNSILISPQFGTEYLFFRTANLPVQNDTFRNALLTAIPWDELRQNSLITASTLILSLNGYPEVTGLGDQDLDAAKLLLKDSGYLSLKNPAPLVIFIPDDKTSIAKAELLKNTWTDLGVQTAIETIPVQDYLASLASSKAQLFSYIWIGDFADPLAFLELFRGKSSLNESGWKDATFDKLLDEASKLTDSSERYKKLAAAEQHLLDSGVIIPISHTVSLNIVDKTVISGWYDNALDIHPYKYIKFIEPEMYPNIVKAE